MANAVCPDPAFCYNGGICYYDSDSKSQSCSCPQMYTGLRCETRTPGRWLSPCPDDDRSECSFGGMCAIDPTMNQRVCIYNVKHIDQALANAIKDCGAAGGGPAGPDGKERVYMLASMAMGLCALLAVAVLASMFVWKYKKRSRKSKEIKNPKRTVQVKESEEDCLKKDSNGAHRSTAQRPQKLFVDESKGRTHLETPQNGQQHGGSVPSIYRVLPEKYVELGCRDGSRDRLPAISRGERKHSSSAEWDSRPGEDRHRVGETRRVRSCPKERDRGGRRAPLVRADSISDSDAAINGNRKLPRTQKSDQTADLGPHDHNGWPNRGGSDPGVPANATSKKRNSTIQTVPSISIDFQCEKESLLPDSIP